MFEVKTTEGQLWFDIADALPLAVTSVDGIHLPLRLRRSSWVKSYCL